MDQADTDNWLSGLLGSG